MAKYNLVDGEGKVLETAHLSWSRAQLLNQSGVKPGTVWVRDKDGRVPGHAPEKKPLTSPAVMHGSVDSKNLSGKQAPPPHTPHITEEEAVAQRQVQLKKAEENVERLKQLVAEDELAHADELADAEVAQGVSEGEALKPEEDTTTEPAPESVEESESGPEEGANDSGEIESTEKVLGDESPEAEVETTEGDVSTVDSIVNEVLNPQSATEPEPPAKEETSEETV